MKITNQHQQRSNTEDQRLPPQNFEHQPDAARALAQLEQEIAYPSMHQQDSSPLFPARFDLELTEPLRIALQDLAVRVPGADDQDLLHLVIAKGIVAMLQLTPRDH